MIKSRLICHADTMPHNPYALEVEVNKLQNRDITLRYCLTGNLKQLIIPIRKSPAAANGLWEHTCFEAFIAVAGEDKYHEFNFSPSGEWAIYAFIDTRKLLDWSTQQAPVITLKHDAESLLLEACIPAVALPPNAQGKPLQLGLSAVLETQDGHYSYWALHHPAPYPDFHDRSGFTLTLS
ncbi:MAG: DOMON-like domain-containing protein [Methylococcales bacterium]